MQRDAPFVFESLDVYRHAVDFADRVIEHTESFTHRHLALSDQLNRAAISIAANIAEGNGRSTETDRRKFFIIARGSLNECIPLLDLAHRRNLISVESHQSLRAQLHRTFRLLSGLIKNPGGHPRP